MPRQFFLCLVHSSRMQCWQISNLLLQSSLSEKEAKEVCLVLVLLGWVFIELKPILQKLMIASQVGLVHDLAESRTENGLARFNRFLFLTQRMRIRRRSTHIPVNVLHFLFFPSHCRSVDHIGFPTALQCRLDCSAGYVSQWAPLVTCVNGRYEPSKPSLFTCEPAVALLVSKSGEMEVFSSNAKCNRKLNNIPQASFDGHTVNLLDNKLILGPLLYTASQDSWSYLSLENPRSGLLADKWTHTTTMAQEVPGFHTSFVHDKDLIYLGGKHNLQTMLQNGRAESGEWNVFTLLRKNGLKFTEFKSSACQIKTKKNMFLVIGGHTNRGSYAASSQVLLVDMKEQSVQELSGLRYARTYHSCAIIDMNKILVSGGLPQGVYGHNSEILPTEVYNVNTGTSEKITDPLMTPRYGHSLVRLEQYIYVMGGKTVGGLSSSSIERFDLTTGTWTKHPETLLSSSTSGLAFTSLPISAVACDQGCQCGIALNRTERIVGGQDAEVSFFNSKSTQVF